MIRRFLQRQVKVIAAGGWELNPLQPRDFTRTTSFSSYIWQEPDKVGTQSH